MNLLVFDIDGTIVDSVKVDDECFTQSFQDLLDIDISKAAWDDFEHVTDSGLTYEIFHKYLERDPRENEISQLKSHFHHLVNQRKHEIMEIEGAKSILTSLRVNTEFSVAFATGGSLHKLELNSGTLF